MSAPRAVTVGTEVKRIVGYSATRTVVMIFNNSDQTVYIGTGEGLTTENGFPIAPNQALVLAREFGDDPTLNYYAVVSTGTADLRVWEGYGNTIGYYLSQLVELMKR